MALSRKSKYFYFEYETSRSEFELPYGTKFSIVANKKELETADPTPEAPPTVRTRQQRDLFHSFERMRGRRYGPCQIGGAILRFHNHHKTRVLKACWLLNKKDKHPQVTGFVQLKTPITLAKFNTLKNGCDVKLELIEDFPSVVGENYNVQDFSN